MPSLPLSEVNYLAVLAGGVIFMAVGFVWYGPIFGKTWMRLAGMSEADVQGGPGLGYLWSFIAALVATFVLSLLIITMGSASFVDGLLAGVLAGVGFVATAMLTNVIFEDKPLGLWLLNAGYQTVTLAIAGGVLAVWR